MAWATFDTAQDGSGSAVKVRQFGADGVPVATSSAQHITTGGQLLPDLATLADGRVVASWASENADGSESGVRGQFLYTANAATRDHLDGGGASASLTLAENETAVTTVVAIDSDGPLRSPTQSRAAPTPARS